MNKTLGETPLVVVSNREPYEHRRSKGRLVCRRTDGGLTSALDPVMRRVKGTWIAWGNGKGDYEALGADSVVWVPPETPAYRLRRVPLTEEEVKGGYLGYANQVLWPLCHITLDRVTYRKAFWSAYHDLNRRFAEAVLDELRKTPGLVWAHDFHLALLPRLIKHASPGRTVAVFWHIPFPGPEVFRILPEAREVLEGLLAADSLVFQTPGYAQAFAECAQQLLGAEASPSSGTIRFRGHEARLTARAISVDFHAFSDHAETSRVEQAMRRLRRGLAPSPGIRLGLGVDRMDYTKGLLKRFWALDAFFTRYPQYQGVFTFLQIAIPTRSELEAYRRYRQVIRETVSEINARYASALPPGHRRWQPIVYREGRIGFDTLVAYYRMADLAVVTPVYDGMNLVAKEYVASQVDENGVLLISQLAGAAEEMTDALVINPYDTERLADSIKQALEMPKEERRRRMRAMRTYLQKHDIHVWMEGCLLDAGVVIESSRASGK